MESSLSHFIILLRTTELTAGAGGVANVLLRRVRAPCTRSSRLPISVATASRNTPVITMTAQYPPLPARVAGRQVRACACARQLPRVYGRGRQTAEQLEGGHDTSSCHAQVARPMMEALSWLPRASVSSSSTANVPCGRAAPEAVC